LGVDLLDVASRKIQLNARKYPIDQVRGSLKEIYRPLMLS